MTMTPEGIINKQTWEILQDIKEESLAPEEDGTLFYDTTRTVIAAGENSPSRERKWAIIRKLAREKAIEITKEIAPDWTGGRNGFYLKLLQPKFDEVYEKYKRACDLTSHLNDYQERMLKGDDNLSELYLIDDKEQAKQAPPIKHRGKMFETGGGGGYYNRNHPIRPRKKQSASEIVDEFSPENYPFVLMVLKKIASLTEFSTDNEVGYKLQSPFGETIIQERSLLKKFEARGMFKHRGEDGVFGIATLSDIDTGLVRQVIAEIEERESGVISEDKFEEIKKKYNQTVQDLRKPNQSSELQERYNKILGEIKSKSKNLDASPQKDTQTPNTFLQKDIQEHESHTFHPDLEVVDEDNIPKIKKGGSVIFTFPNNWSGKYRYFKCLWQNQGVKKSYKEVYEFESNLKYPEKGVWRINRNIRNTINKLRKELEAKKLPIRIETNKGFILTIQNL